MTVRGSGSGKVLLTGGSGFIASHVLDSLLDHGFSVVVTVRSDEKGRAILDTTKAASRSAVSYVVVGDISEDDAFDAAVQSNPPFDYVVHTASPYHLNVQDPVKDFLDPAIKGTTGILKSVKAFAPQVKRIVITSSSAAMLNPMNHAKIYNESIWAPFTWQDGMKPENTYPTSKVLSEKAAWNFVATQSPNFSLSVINCTYTFGPIQRGLPSLESMNTSNHRIRNLILGRFKEGLPPTYPVFTFVDVRDVALAHVRALMEPEAGGKRFYVVGGHFSNRQLLDIIRTAYPGLEDKLPAADVAVDDLPEDVYQFDNSRSRTLLELKYTNLQKSVCDTVDSILAFGCD